jgi:hypothetical protein
MRRLVNHMGIILISFMISCETRSSFNPPDENYFLKYFGNAGNQEGVDFVVNPDGSFVLIGNSRSTPSSDQQVYVAKADAKGNIIWEKTFGGRFEEEAKDIELLPDGNLIVLANSANNSFVDVINRERDVMLLKIGQDGSKIDSVKQGLTDGNFNDTGLPTDEDASSVTVLSDGFIVVGGSGIVPQSPVDKSSFINIRFSNDLSWITDRGGQWKSESAFFSNGESKTVKLLYNNSRFYGMGYSNVNFQTGATASDFNFSIYEVGPKGDLLGKNTFGDIIFNEKLTSVSITPSGGYLLTGISQNLGDGDIYILRLVSSIVFGLNNDPVNYILPPQRIKLGKTTLVSSFNFSTQSNFFVTVEKLNGTSNDISLRKLDNSGNELFEKTFGGVGDDFAGPVVELPDGHIVMIGTFTLGGVVDGQKKIVFMKLNKEGRLAP